MRRFLIALVSVALMFVVVAGTGLVVWHVRALKLPQAEYLIQSELLNVSGFTGARVQAVHSIWSTARAAAEITFEIRDFKQHTATTTVHFVRLDGSWRTLRVESEGRQYASLNQLGNETMVDLRREYAAYLGEMAAETGQLAGEAIAAAGKELGDAIVEKWQEVFSGEKDQ